MNLIEIKIWSILENSHPTHIHGLLALLTRERSRWRHGHRRGGEGRWPGESEARDGVGGELCERQVQALGTGTRQSAGVQPVAAVPPRRQPAADERGPGSVAQQTHGWDILALIPRASIVWDVWMSWTKKDANTSVKQRKHSVKICFKKKKSMGGLLSGCCCFFINLSKNDGDVMIYTSSCVLEEISHYDSLMRLLISGALRLGSRKERRSRCHWAEFFFFREREKANIQLDGKNSWQTDVREWERS